ncbi:MAG: aminotransferase class III-fold pyridoxal phosphate-dependent enzyme, partial [Alphaproteobacteria bacterium]
LEAQWMPFTGNRDFKENPRMITKAQGAYVWNQKGDRLIDASSGLFNVPAGHSRKEIADAVYGQMLQNSYSLPFQTGQPASFALAEKLVRLLPDPLNHVFFTNSGSESIDTALKIAMAFHRARGQGHRTRFVSRERAYHGVNIGGISLSGMVKNREAFSGVMPNIVMMRHTFDGENLFERGEAASGAARAEDLTRIIETYGGSTIAAVFVEPVAGSTGVLVPPKGYLKRLREICDQHDILLIFDEVITGFGRLGTPFASDYFGVVPDMITMAKAITNGAIPMGAVAVSDDIYETITNAAPENAIELFHGYTYSGHPAACAAGLASLKIYEDEGLFEQAAALSNYFLDAVWSLKDLAIIKDLRGIGLMAGIELHPSSKGAGMLGTRLQKELFWNGCCVKWTGDTAILAPPFIVNHKEIDEMIDLISKILKPL